MDPRAELTRHLRQARAWILGVAVCLFAIEMFVVHIWWHARIDAVWRERLTLYDTAILVYFVGLWWLVPRWPVACCVLALVSYWVLQIYLAVIEPATLSQLLLVKTLFTIALVNGISSARRAARLQRTLAAFD